MTQPERREFQAEVQQLLNLMVHSLYSDKDVFLRELVSNASDAIDKRQFAALTAPELAVTGEPAITLTTDAEARTLSIADTGIGMSRDEVVSNLGTIARSGTKEFLASVRAAAKSGGDAPSAPAVAPELIGQFGVGFYAAFMVAESITVVTRRAGETTATRWVSAGDGTYTIEPAERIDVGTTVTLKLRPADAEAGMHDYTDASVLGDIVKRYSDFVGYPIRLGDQVLNSQKAIWDRPRSEVTDAEYNEFYKHVTRDWNDPLRAIPVRMEGTVEAHALLYLPKQAPFDLYSAEMKRGVQLYVKRVFVMDECKELMPTYLRFVKGVVDAHDLSLNVSREILQKDRGLGVIKKQLVKKTLATLDEMKRDAPDDYLAFWRQFGPVLKEGLIDYGTPDKDKLLDLVLAASTREGDALVSLADYVARMPESQDSIYFLAGTSIETVSKSPLLEAFRAAGAEVLLFADPIDELWLESAPRYKDKPLVSIARGAVAPGSDAERKAAAEKLEAESATYKDLLLALRAQLQEDVKDVRLSARLTSSIACLVSDANDLTPRLQRMLEGLGQAPPKAKPILELNPGHALLPKLQALYTESAADPRLGQYARVLLGQAYLADTGTLPDAAAFNTALGELLVRS